jgi:hypothetical protein
VISPARTLIQKSDFPFFSSFFPDNDVDDNFDDDSINDDDIDDDDVDADDVNDGIEDVVEGLRGRGGI